MASGGNRVVALIPARAGSSGLPAKNIRMFAGKALFLHSIDFAVACGIPLADVFVSSDDAFTLELAARHGAQALERPAELSLGSASMDSVIGHLVEHLRARGALPDSIVLLQPTNPFRDVAYYHEAVAKLATGQFDCILTVNRLQKKFGKLDDAGRYLPVRGGPTQRRQDMEPLFSVNGLLFLFSLGGFLRTRTAVGERIGAVITRDVYAHNDIDSEFDLRLLEHIALSCGQLAQEDE